MAFIPHTEKEIQQMLAAIRVDSINDLFDEIPANLRCPGLDGIKPGMSEREVSQSMNKRAAMDGVPVCFVGAGAYEHYIPAVIWDIVTRGEFYSAYTPYQAEASQGTLQVVYEFQSMIAALTGMDVANASLYDGASGLAEAVLMSVRANRKAKSKKILMPDTVSPVYRQVVHSITHNQKIELHSLPFDPETGKIASDGLTGSNLPDNEKFAAVVIPMPNFFGQIEEVHHLTDWAHQQGALVIALVNPMALGLFEAPGNWGEKGADIVVGEGQPLGIPLASGGPYFGFMASKMNIVRQLPGRIIGRTNDLDGKSGFTLTLQAREQHIRRSKATSNICTNQGLMATAATIYMALMGSQGIRQVAQQCYQNTNMLKAKLAMLEGVQVLFTDAHFHEIVLQLPVNVSLFLDKMAQRNTIGGYDLGVEYPELGEVLMICVTENRTEQEMDNYLDDFKALLDELGKAN